MSHEKETKQTPAAETKAPETEAKAVCDAARLDDIMRFYSGRDAQ